MTAKGEGGPRDAVAGPATVANASRRPAGWDFSATGAIEDAEFESVDLSRAIFSSPTGFLDRTDRATAASGGLGILTRSYPKSRGTWRSSSRLAWLPALAIGLAAFHFAASNWLPPLKGRSTVLRAPAELKIEEVATHLYPGVDDGLYVGGVVRNAGETGVMAPPLVVAVSGRDGLVARYYLGTSGRFLAAHEGFNFSGRLPAPIEGAETVQIYFNPDGGGR